MTDRPDDALVEQLAEALFVHHYGETERKHWPSETGSPYWRDLARAVEPIIAEQRRAAVVEALAEVEGRPAWMAMDLLRKRWTP